MARAALARGPPLCLSLCLLEFLFQLLRQSGTPALAVQRRQPARRGAGGRRAGQTLAADRQRALEAR